MNVTPVKTHKITIKDKDILEVLDKYLPALAENTVIAVASKIIAICEGRIAKMGEVEKDTLIEKEADFFLPRSGNKYGVALTITQNHLVATAGIDESNGDGYYILWPKDLQKSANTIREHLKKKHTVKNIGVIITDSRTTPLRWGVTGLAIAYSGINPLHSYVGQGDIFGRTMEFTQESIVDGLASAATVTMGEGAEQTPLAIITGIPFVEFQDRNPTQEELDRLKIEPSNDLYAPLLTNVPWEKGKKG